MAYQETDTNGFKLVPENNYDAMIKKAVRKEVSGGLIIYDWHFESLLDGKPYNFKIGMFPSQMAELLKALGAEEITKGKFKWDDKEVVGHVLNFNIGHVADKKGILREQLSDIKLMSKETNVDKSEWDE